MFLMKMIVLVFNVNGYAFVEMADKDICTTEVRLCR